MRRSRAAGTPGNPSVSCAKRNGGSLGRMRRKTQLLLAGIVCLALQRLRSQTPTTISSRDAARHVGETVSVRGVVVAVFTSRNNNTFLNFDRPYPRQTFQGVIFRAASAAFGDPRQYEGKDVVVIGRIRLYNGKPEIILDSPSQIRLADEAPAPPLPDSGPTTPIRATRPCAVRVIIDGDTIECSRLGSVRLVGIDAPERDQAPFGASARAALLSIISLRDTVQLEFDVEGRDQYDRLLAYVWKKDSLVNWLLVRWGWAVQLTYPPNVQYVDWFTEAERRAREEGRGLWAVSGFDCRPVDHRAHRCD
jgi:micrococcal nuclease